MGGLDVAFDGVGGDIGRAAFELVRAGGRFCAYGMASGAFVAVSPDEADRREVRLARGASADPATLRELALAALSAEAEGRLRPVIGQVLPLASAAEAHARIEARDTVGKTLLSVRAGR